MQNWKFILFDIFIKQQLIHFCLPFLKNNWSTLEWHVFINLFRPAMLLSMRYYYKTLFFSQQPQSNAVEKTIQKLYQGIHRDRLDNNMMIIYLQLHNFYTSSQSIKLGCLWLLSNVLYYPCIKIHDCLKLKCIKINHTCIKRN